MYIASKSKLSLLKCWTLSWATLILTSAWLFLQSRFAVNSVTSADYGRPYKIAAFVAELDAGFRLLNLKNDSLRKKFDGLKYDLKKIEEVVYDLTIRGLKPAMEDVTWRKEIKTSVGWHDFVDYNDLMKSRDWQKPTEHHDIMTISVVKVLFMVIKTSGLGCSRPYLVNSGLLRIMIWPLQLLFPSVLSLSNLKLHRS